MNGSRAGTAKHVRAAGIVTAYLPSISAATASDRRSTAVTGCPGRARGGPWPWRPRSSSRRSTPGQALHSSPAAAFQCAERPYLGGKRLDRYRTGVRADRRLSALLRSLTVRGDPLEPRLAWQLIRVCARPSIGAEWPCAGRRPGGMFIRWRAGSVRVGHQAVPPGSGPAGIELTSVNPSLRRAEGTSGAGGSTRIPARGPEFGHTPALEIRPVTSLSRRPVRATRLCE